MKAASKQDRNYPTSSFLLLLNGVFERWSESPMATFGDVRVSCANMAQRTCTPSTEIQKTHKQEYNKEQKSCRNLHTVYPLYTWNCLVHSVGQQDTTPACTSNKRTINQLCNPTGVRVLGFSPIPVLCTLHSCFMHQSQTQRLKQRALVREILIGILVSLVTCGVIAARLK